MINACNITQPLYTYVLGFTTKITVRIDEEVELGNNNPLDDCTVKPNMSAVPEMVEAAADPNDKTLNGSHYLLN